MRHIGIIGGGIIGLCSAYYLDKAGYKVTVFDQNTLTDGCSFGNAGMIVPSHIIPLAQPGMMAKGMRMLLRSTSPFYIKPRLSADLLRWGWLFYKHSTPEHVERAIPALRDISLLSKKLYQELARTDGLSFGWKEDGLLMLYKTAAAEHEMAEEAEVANRAGIEALQLSGAQVQDLEPEARVDVRGAVYYPGDAHLNPGQFIRSLVAYLKTRGVTLLENQSVSGFGRSGSRITSVKTVTAEHPVDEVVLAAGAWSPSLMRLLGISLPLQGGKGYSFMLRNQRPNIRVPAIMLEARATATPMGADLRFAGTLEVAGTDLSVNMNRVRGIVNSIQNYYPDLPAQLPDVSKVWSGLRPCSPDGLPYIGRVSGFENLTLATGHGMMGVSLGPASGKLVADCLGNRTPAMELHPFNPDRFR
ncbi:NAD(P)/FAD-dependent oxidoreductase [Larkinella humicola]|uniref:FAD-dependent oxidoreductase n=1 Tax=Larkinella humicola TaxID=2607654 RepID=A0A5N1JN20_9BACT|nr:FAD-dependent oxidoreductase [Larkinella humicola]KAA9357664.1 FAD-dependent oxidoreductase [Larkinella humicola]